MLRKLLEMTPLFSFLFFLITLDIHEDFRLIYIYIVRSYAQENNNDVTTYGLLQVTQTVRNDKSFFFFGHYNNIQEVLRLYI